MDSLKTDHGYMGFGQTWSRKRDRRKHRWWAAFYAKRGDEAKAAQHRRYARNG